MNHFENHKGQPAPNTEQAGTPETSPKPKSPGAFLEWIKANKKPSEGNRELEEAVRAGLLEEIIDEETTRE